MGKIEKQNAININIIGYESKRLYPIRISEEKYHDHIEILYITEEPKEKYHYVLIQNFNRLMFNFSQSLLILNNLKKKEHA